MLHSATYRHKTPDPYCSRMALGASRKVLETWDRNQWVVKMRYNLAKAVIGCCWS